jgi:outer membrane protein assembly factor BamB
MSTRHGVSLAALLSATLTAVAAGSGAPAAATPATGTVVAPGWTQDGYGPGNDGFNPLEAWLLPGRVPQLAKQWSITAKGQEVCARQSAPVVADGRLYLTGRVGLGGYSADTGARIWSRPYPDPMDMFTPLLAVSGDTLLAGTSGCQSTSDPDGDLLALNGATGALRWRVHTEAPDYTLTVDRDVVVVGGSDAGYRATTAFRVDNGKRLWQRVDATPAAGVSAGGTMLLSDYGTASDRTGAVAVDISTGAVRWKTTRSWSVQAADPAGLSFLVRDPDGTLLKVDAATGRIVWTKRGLAGPVAVDAGHVYVAWTAPGGDKSAAVMLSLAADTGRIVWRRAGYAALLRPVVAGGVLYAVAPKQRLETLDAATGRRLRFTATGQPIDHPVVTGGWLYLTDGTHLRGYTVPGIRR